MNTNSEKKNKKIYFRCHMLCSPENVKHKQNVKMAITNMTLHLYITTIMQL